MLLQRRSFLALAGISLLGACTAVVPPAAGPSPGPKELTRDAIVSAINRTRAANGRAPLSYNTMLEAAARSQANLMASKDQLSHNLGVTLRERVRAAGYVGAVGENLAGGHTTLDQAIQGWLESPAHRAALLSNRFVEFGLAAATVAPGVKSRYRIYWAFIAGGPFEAWVD
ncbi:MAG: CAP domain-containing protein [Devosia sp.]